MKGNGPVAASSDTFKSQQYKIIMNNGAHPTKHPHWPYILASHPPTPHSPTHPIRTLSTVG
eukprot:UN02179